MLEGTSFYKISLFLNDIVNLKMDKQFEEIRRKKNRIKLTSSGRISKTPKKLWTTEDEAPPEKRTKSLITIQEETERLRNMLKQIQQNKKDDIHKSSKNHIPAPSVDKDLTLNRTKKDDINKTTKKHIPRLSTKKDLTLTRSPSVNQISAPSINSGFTLLCNNTSENRRHPSSSSVTPNNP